MATACLQNTNREISCRDIKAARNLKCISLGIIFFTSITGISFPVLLARYFHGKSLYDKAILVIKCFAAGVILSTSLVHVLPDAHDALSDCQVASRHPWKDFPFVGLVVLIGVLISLLVDMMASSHVENGGGGNEYSPVGELGKVDLVKMKQRLVSQVLEIGIVFHSIIIGVTMGMSQNKCTIRPLVVALAFHQVFEGMGLGGCIAQAGFDKKMVAYMCFMFSVTTPAGIVVGMMVSSLTNHDEHNAGAMIMEGLLGALSSGILLYMGLVDLVAIDFFHNKLMSSSPPLLKKASYCALVFGSVSMSILALWA